MLLNLEGFKYAMTLELNMGYYHIRLSAQAINLWTIIPPLGKYQYKCLPTGVNNSPDIFQGEMNEIFCGFEFIRPYIDEILIIIRVDYSNQLEKLELTLQNIKDNGLKFNNKKSFFGQTEMEYLGFWLTWTGIRPINKN